MRRPPSHLFGILYFITAMAFFSGMNVMIRHMAGDLDPLQMVFIRNAFSFLMLLPFALRHGLSEVKTTRPGRHILRSVVGLTAMESWFYSLAHMPVNTATAISFSAPLFSTVFAVFLLGERIGWMRITALLIGFAGVVIILDPSATATLDLHVLVVLFATAMMALSGIIVKTLTVTEPSWRIVLYMTFIMSLLSLPPALTVWTMPSLSMIGQLAVIAFLSTTAQMALTQALKEEYIVVLVPFEFLRLVFTALLAWIALSEILTLETVLGSLIIVGSSAFITWRESVRKRQITSEDALSS